MAQTQTQDPYVDDCIEACQQCHAICLKTALGHCLEQGNEHVELEHFRLMMNCADICQTAANFMLGQSPLHAAVCAACAEVCTACADSCEDIGDMDDCVRICRECAESCEGMALVSSQQQGQSAQSQQPRL